MLQVIRHYHGHLSGVYSLALHPNLDLLMTGGRDSVCRVWDMRSKVQAHVLSGHDDTVCSILSQASDPQVGPSAVAVCCKHSMWVTSLFDMAVLFCVSGCGLGRLLSRSLTGISGYLSSPSALPQRCDPSLSLPSALPQLCGAQRQHCP